ncbi:hypothetical protein Syun_006067 [Stephania yunnanensis]|uniref:WAT1-related protein n=1 Tax=Stephania yunnanensis TaxID=152371 RepID=A0AAP0KVZ0_9MAGN
MASCVKKVAIEMAPHLSMVVIQLSTAGYVVLSQAILIQGTSSIILAFYSFLSATIYMGILAVIFERKKKPPLNGSILVWTVILSFVGVSLTQNMLIACLYFIPATTETAISNMVPILTYALSVVLRQERLQLNTWCGRGKLLGTLTLAFGALVLVFWTNGPALLKLPLTITMGASRFGYWF